MDFANLIFVIIAIIVVGKIIDLAYTAGQTKIVKPTRRYCPYTNKDTKRDKNKFQF